MQRDGLLRGVAFGEIVAFQDARHGELARQPQEIGEGELPEPVRVAPQLGLVGVEDLERLRNIGLGVGVDLLDAQRRPGRVAPGWITNQSSEVSDDEDDGVPEVLELAQFAQRNGVSEVKVGGGRVDSEFDTQGGAFGQLPPEVGEWDQIGDTALNHVQLVFGAQHLRESPRPEARLVGEHGRYSEGPRDGAPPVRDILPNEPPALVGSRAPVVIARRGRSAPRS